MISHQGTKGPCPSEIPWEAIAPYEGQAKVNHDQTLERLAQRGGLDPVEAFFVMTGRTWNNFPKMTDELEREACAFLDKIVRDRNTLRVELDAALLKLEDEQRQYLLVTRQRDEYIQKYSDTLPQVRELWDVLDAAGCDCSLGEVPAKVHAERCTTVKVTHLKMRYPEKQGDQP
jgi:hypothetical protein